jgi:hypothetical protein
MCDPQCMHGMQAATRTHDATTHLHDAAHAIQLLLMKIQADDSSSMDGKGRAVAVAATLRGRLGELEAIKQVCHLQTRIVTSLNAFVSALPWVLERSVAAEVVGKVTHFGIGFEPCGACAWLANGWRLPRKNP